MSSLITRHLGVNAPASAPVISVSDVEVQVSRIPGLKAWWRADALFNPDPTAGAWRDRVNDIALTLRRASWPVRTPGGIADRDYLQFNQQLGTILQTPADVALWPVGPNPWTFAWVGQPSPNNFIVNEGVFGNEQAGAGQLVSAVFYQGNSANKPIVINEGGADLGYTTAGFPASGGPHLVVLSRNPGADAESPDRLRCYVDGVGQTTVSRANPQNTNSRLLVGGNTNTAGSGVTNAGFGGRIYDLFVFHSVLTAGDRAILSAYSYERYGLPA
ncbi:hypothetical protein [Achromobacter piechaudii]|uniref:Uncharacterized protein n=1 Tax=Achromobacter piechaudii TaxID=72556 RepID=A0A6S7DTL9_9BURK|nr:hypothetical protein [Achromobacter piechaudii]CAB3889553.1 hypothetical protein LMG1861_03728 [Achromobacter piechaudii]CAB3959602.1 hypothetical protein LMG6103_05851 [Achromobacter piechaudii]